MIIMVLTDITLDDLVLLEQMRIERLRSFFSQSLRQCDICIDRSNRLTIYCPESWLIDLLMDDMEELSNYAWLILGAECIVLSFAQEEIYRADHYRFPKAIRNLVQWARPFL